jgi:hypothetical protein
MKEDEKTSSTGISRANTLEEMGDFWDSHSLADHWDETHEVAFDVRAQRRRRITIDPEQYDPPQLPRPYCPEDGLRAPMDEPCTLGFQFYLSAFVIISLVILTATGMAVSLKNRPV